MPYDPMGSGYGQYSRGNGNYGIRSIYGYGDQGAIYNPQQKQPPNPSQTMGALAPNQGMTQVTPQGDFFTQLAGLFGMGGQMGGPPAQPQMSPAQYGYNQALYGNQNAMAQSAASHVMPSQTYGGRGAFSGQPLQYGAGGGIINPYAGNQNFQMGTGGAYGPASAPTRGSSSSSMTKTGRPMRAPGSEDVYSRAPGLMASNSPALAEKNPLESMPSARRAPQSSGRASMGRNPMAASSFRDPGSNGRPGVYY
jgi:hypothetical protein